MSLRTPNTHEMRHTIRMTIPSGYRVVGGFTKLYGHTQLDIKRKSLRGVPTS